MWGRDVQWAYLVDLERDRGVHHTQQKLGDFKYLTKMLRKHCFRYMFIVEINYLAKLLEMVTLWSLS